MGIRGWGNPWVIGGLVVGLVLLGLFVVVEQRVAEPLFNMDLFRIRAFSLGCMAQLLSALAYGGFQFALVVWLQGIWLPLHGYAFEDTPLWAALYLIPLLVGFMIAGAGGGWLSDRLGPRGLSTGGMVLLGLGFIALTFFPADFDYPPFAVVLFGIGVAFGIFAAPNTAAIMNALPRDYRGVGSGMRSTFQNVGNPLSLAVFFSIIVVGLANQLPGVIQNGLTQQGVPTAAATTVAHIPPTGALFAAFLGYNPMQTLLPPAALAQLPAATQSNILGTHFFPTLISAPFVDALHTVFWAAALMAFVAAGCSWLRGERFVYDDTPLVVPLRVNAPSR